MTLLYIPEEPSDDWCKLYLQLASEWAAERQIMLLIALALWKRAKEDGNTTLAEGAAVLIELMEKKI